MKINKLKHSLSLLTPFISFFLILLIIFFISVNAFKQSGMYPTHDGEIHVIRSIHFGNEFERGQIPVRMLPDLAYSFGYSTFIFNYPFPYYLATIFQNFGFAATTSWKLMQVLATTLSLVFFYLWTRCHTDKKASLTAATLFGLIPFRLLTLYVTGQIGGYSALIFAPLIALGLNKLLSSKNKNMGGVILSIGVAGIIVSHLLSVIIFFIPLSGYAAWLLQKEFSWKKVGSLFLWTLLAVGLSAFYFLPFMIEKSWIKLGHQILVDHRDHWPTLKQLVYSPWGYGHSNPGDADGMSFQVGLSLIVSWALATAIIFFKKNKNSLAKMFSIIFAVLFFLMLPISAPIWEIVIPLQLIQFPWRILAAAGFVGSWLAGWSINKLSGKKSWLAMAVLLSISIYNARNYTKPWPLDWREDKSYLQDSHAFNGPADISWELMPITATKIPNDTPYLVANATDSAITVNNISYPKNGEVRKIIEVEASKKIDLNLSIWDLPVWLVKVNGTIAEKKASEDGTITIAIDEGLSKVEVILQKTKLEIVSDFITITSIGVLISVIALPKIAPYINKLSRKK